MRRQIDIAKFPTQTLTVLQDSEEWSTEFKNIEEIRLDGKKINDVHDLCISVQKVTKCIRIMAYIAIGLAVMACIMCGSIAWWLHNNHDQITHAINRDGSVNVKKVLAENKFYRESLAELNFKYENGEWIKMKKVSSDSFPKED